MIAIRGMEFPVFLIWMKLRFSTEEHIGPQLLKEIVLIPEEDYHQTFHRKTKRNNGKNISIEAQKSS